jgi:hypothetical protein
MNAEIQAPVEFAGDLMGDLIGRRGRISGMDTKGSTQFIRAQVPMAEMLNYQNDLTAMSHVQAGPGRGGEGRGPKLPPTGHGQAANPPSTVIAVPVT